MEEIIITLKEISLTKALGLDAYEVLNTFKHKRTGKKSERLSLLMRLAIGDRLINGVKTCR
ncbi:hypothetical protein J1N35_038303 [Gossypium stocksii]|uniref:Uncharacterized protein n=1 Tax=Gossypium stocksii TaxID=47602 RepID=A0A9D3UNK1_9ROSI|nr:hypothetical protein J1N35_038303 [Gossypium stocksii]